MGKEITTGASNTLVGVKAGEDLTTDSSQNVAIGGGALSDSSNAVDGAKPWISADDTLGNMRVLDALRGQL